MNGDQSRGDRCALHIGLAFSSMCCAVRSLEFSVLHGKGESKYRPVATNFQFLKMFCPLSHPCWGKRLSGQSPSICCRRPRCHLKAPLGLSLLRNRGPSPNPALASHRWCECGVSHYIALSIPERAFIIFTGGRIWLK